MGHASQSELTNTLEAAKKQVPIGSVWAHYKKPDANYTVVGVVLVEATEQPAIIYQANYSAGLTWMRPLDDWLASVEVDGRSVPRFRQKS